MYMKNIKSTILLVALLLWSMTGMAQKAKNLIVLIPDGCGISTVSTARWFQWYNQGGEEFLNIDPYLSGTVRTTCSNAPIGDSAPTTSTYMTGYNSRAGWVSTYPTADPGNDIYPMDPERAYQPLTTVFEAARLTAGKSLGLVCTCEFPHATPADCSSHSYDRGKYDWIMPQQAHNGINVLIGGGAGILPKQAEEHLKEKGYGVFRNDINAMRTYQGDNMWALFAHQDMAYEVDRDPAKEPSISEMTKIAIEKLSKNPNGFCLMVEGSKVDWAAHANDLPGMVHDFLAFDKACKEAFDFAKKDGNTVVIVVPDHSNSGLSIGRRDWGGYATTPLNKTFGAMTNFKASGDVIAYRLNHSDNSEVQKIFKELCGFELTERELQVLNNHKKYDKSPIAKDDRRPARGGNYNQDDLARLCAQFMTERTGLAFTTNGHTGEDVFLASYHPQAQYRPSGMLTNIQLNAYLCQSIGLTHDKLDQITAEQFVPHTKVAAAQGLTCEIIDSKYNGKDTKTLVIKAPKTVLKNNEIWIQANTNIMELRTKKGAKVISREEMRTVAIYVDKNNTFYIPSNIDYFLVGRTAN